MNDGKQLLGFGILSVALLGFAGTRVHARLLGDSGDSHSTARVSSERSSAFQSQEFGAQLFHQTFQGNALSVRLEDADVVLESGSGNEVEVRFFVRARDEEWGREVFDRMDVDVAERGGVVYVEARDADVDRDEWRNNRGVGVTAVISVPTGFDVEVRTGDGDISAESLSGATSLATGDGDIVARSLDGDVELSTDDGDVVVGHLRGGRATIRTGDGDVVVERAAAALRLSTGDGDVHIALAEALETSITTGDGDVSVTAPSNLQANFSLDGEELDIARGLQLEGVIRSHSVEASMNGGGPTIQVRTGDGTVSLRASN